MESRMVVWASFPLLVILIFIGLAFFWMVHHHLWKPLMGILLVGAGLFFFSLVTYNTHGLQEVVEPFGPKSEASMHRTGRVEIAPVPDKAPAAEQVTSDANKPAWIDQPPHTDDGDVYVVAVTSGPYQTQAECEDALAAAIDKEVRTFAEKLDPAAANEPLSLDKNYRQILIRERYGETIKSSLGPMQQLDAQLAFTDKVRAELIRQINQFVIDKRLSFPAAAGGVMLLLLGAAYLLLRRPARTPEGSKPFAGR